jgi:hypothetical protein
MKYIFACIFCAMFTASNQTTSAHACIMPACPVQSNPPQAVPEYEDPHKEDSRNRKNIKNTLSK